MTQRTPCSIAVLILVGVIASACNAPAPTEPAAAPSTAATTSADTTYTPVVSLNEIMVFMSAALKAA